MGFFCKTPSRKQLQEQIDACRADLDALRQQVDGFCGQFEAELGGLRKDFHELVLFLKEGGGEEGCEAEAPRTLLLATETVEMLQGGMAALAERLEGLEQRDAASGGGMEQIQAMMESGFGELQKQLTDARKDIANRISYAVSRLRT